MRKEWMEGNFFAKKFPSTPPFKKLLNGGESRPQNVNLIASRPRGAPESGEAIQSPPLF